MTQRRMKKFRLNSHESQIKKLAFGVCFYFIIPDVQYNSDTTSVISYHIIISVHIVSECWETACFWLAAQWYRYICHRILPRSKLHPPKDKTSIMDYLQNQSFVSVWISGEGEGDGSQRVQAGYWERPWSLPHGPGRPRMSTLCTHTHTYHQANSSSKSRNL